MSRNTRPAGAYLEPVIETTGVPAAQGPGRGVFTLAAATYFIAIDGPAQSALESVHFQWSTGLIGVITFWDTNFGETEAPLISAISGDWIQEDSSSAYIPVTGTGASVASMTITLAGGGIGGAMVHLGNLGSGRLRARVVVSTGGTLRTAGVGKQ